MSKTFACPNCKQKLTATPDMAGALVDCPACGQKIQIPAFDASVPMQNAVQPVPPQYPPQQTQPYQQPYAQPQYAPQQMQPYQQPYAPPPQMQPYQQSYAPRYQQPYPPQYQRPNVKMKSKGVAAVLCFFFGWFGIHNFYLGRADVAAIQFIMAVANGVWVCLSWSALLSGEAAVFTTGWALVWSLTIVALNLWVFIDFILILCGSLKDGDGHPLE